MAELQQLPSEINISAVFRDSFTTDIDFDIDMTGYVVSAFVDIVGGDQEVFTVLAETLEWALEGYPEYADLHYHCSQVYQRQLRPSWMLAFGYASVKWYRSRGEAMSLEP